MWPWQGEHEALPALIAALSSRLISRDMAEVPPLCQAGLAFGTAQPQTDLWSRNNKRRGGQRVRQKTVGLRGRSQRALPRKLAGGAGGAQQRQQGQGQGTGDSVRVKAALDFPTVHSPSGKVVLGQGNQPGDQVINARAGRDHRGYLQQLFA